YTMGSCLRRHPVGGPDVLLHVDGSNTGAGKIFVARSQRRLLRGGKAEGARGVAANVTLVSLGSRRDLGERDTLTHHCLLLRRSHGHWGGGRRFDQRPDCVLAAGRRLVHLRGIVAVAARQERTRWCAGFVYSFCCGGVWSDAPDERPGRLHSRRPNAGNVYVVELMAAHSAFPRIDRGDNSDRNVPTIFRSPPVRYDSLSNVSRYTPPTSRAPLSSRLPRRPTESVSPWPTCSHFRSRPWNSSVTGIPAAGRPRVVSRT